MSLGSVPALPRSTPEDQGVDSFAILGLLGAADQHSFELHSLMIMRHGHIIAEGWWEPYRPDSAQLLYSLSKSFTSAAIGLAVGEGRLDVDDRVTSFFPEMLPDPVSDNLAAMRVRHLLAMATGHSEDTIERAAASWPDDWVRGFLSIAPEREPGTHFTYNNGATHMLAAIAQQATGEDLLDYLRPRLLDPLGIHDAEWLASPSGIRFGFSGLHLTTEAIARFGQLHLQNGEWNGQHILTNAWVGQATAVHIENAENDSEDWRQGYGYQFWRSRNGYRGDGAFGQFCIVLPEQDAVIVTTGATEDMQGLIDLVWQYVLPAMHPDAIPPSSGSSRLRAALGALGLPPVSGAPEPVEPVGALGSAIRAPFDVALTPFEGIALDRDDDGWVVLVESKGRMHRLRCGEGEWKLHRFDDEETTYRTVAVSGAWTSADEFTAEFVYTSSPHRLRLKWQFLTDGPTLTLAWNVAPLG